MKYVTLLPENTGRKRSAHIFISYSTSTIPSSARCRTTVRCRSFRNGLGRSVKIESSVPLTESRYWNTIYVKLGPTVLLIRNSSQTVRLLPMLRRTLTALSLYPLFLRYQPQNVSPSTLDFWVERYLERNLHRYSQLPLRTLLKEALNSALELETILSGTKIIVPTILDVKALLIKIHIAVCNHINVMILPNLSGLTFYQIYPKELISLVDLLYPYRDLPDGVILSSDDWDKITMNIYTQLLVSRIFCDNVRILNWTPWQYLQKIEEFYFRLDYLHLKDFFESQSKYFLKDFADEADYVYFYNNSDYDVEEFKNSFAYRAFNCNVKTLAKQFMKHKIQNDKNNMFVYG